MATARDVVAGAATITKIPPATLVSIQRRFGETNLWPTARGPNVPDLSTKNLAHFILGILADAKGKDVVAAACSYYCLRNEDGEQLGDFLCRLIESLKDASSPLAPVAFKSRLEIDCDSPRACFTMHTTEGTAEILFGLQTVQWDDIAVRKSMTISGRSLYYFACGFFHDDWAAENYAA